MKVSIDKNMVWALCELVHDSAHKYRTPKEIDEFIAHVKASAVDIVPDCETKKKSSKT